MENEVFKLVEVHYYVDEDDRIVENRVYERLPEILPDVIEKMTVVPDEKKRTNKKKKSRRKS